MKRVHLTILVLLSLVAPLFAQDYAFESLTVEDGLSQSSVTCLAQDEKGFIWIGTRDGLNRYDGQEVTIFRKIPFDSTSLQSNIINRLLIDHQHGVYVSTAKGLQRYNPNTQQFVTIYLTEDKSPIEVRGLYQDQTQHIWAATTNGFFRIAFDFVTEHYEVTPYLYTSKQIGESNVVVYSIFQEESGTYWVATADGIFRSTSVASNTPSFSSESIPVKRTSSLILDFQQTASGTIIGFGNDGLYVFQPEQNEFLSLSESDQNDPNARLMRIDTNQFWANSSNGIKFILLGPNQEIAESEIDLPMIGLSQSRHQINYILKDNIYEDLYWLATDLGGVLKMHKRKRNFHTIQLKDISNLNITNPYLRHITSTGDIVWINLGAGILLHDRKNETFRLIDDIFPSDSVASATSVSSLYRSPSGKVYASIKGQVIELFMDDQDRLHTHTYPIGPQQASEVNAMIETEHYFIRGDRTRLVSVARKDNFEEVHQFTPALSEQSVVRNEISAFLFDRQSNLWVGTAEGLFVYPNFIPGYDPLQKPIHLQYHQQDTTGLIEDRITALHQDSRGIIWICTRNGLMTAKMKDRHVALTAVDHPSLNNKVIYGILEDLHSYEFWMSSNHGLYRYDPVTGKVDNFDIHDGIQGNEFNSFSFYQSPEGEMFFGGTQGVTSFYPGEIESDTTLPPVWITTLTTTDNQTYNLLTHDRDTPLELNFSERSFSIRYIGLNYLELADQEYYYNLKGSASLSDIPLSNGQQVNFSQLDPGSYTLEIYSKDKFGTQKGRSDQLLFIIRAPFWRSLWFIALLALSFAFIGWLLFYLHYQNKLKHLKAVDLVRKSISEDFHDELGSKLSIISMYSEFTKQELNKENSKASEYLDKVNDTASRLYENTRDLIWALNPQHDSLYDLFIQLKDFGEEMFQDTEVGFHSAGLSEFWKNKNLPMRYKRHLLLIFKEAMHNALKHSGCRNIKLSIDEKDQKLIIMLQDDGKGFDAALEKNGDGLKNMAYRATQLQSELHIISKKEGTRIWVELPFGVLKQKK